jgi:hypothetical protein
MRNKIFPDVPKTIKTSAERWLYIFPDEGEGYRLHDPVREEAAGRILFDDADNWVYDGGVLTVSEQEEVAGKITGHQKEMDELLNSLKEK